MTAAVGDTYPGAGPHDGHTITVTAVDGDDLTVACSCGSGWTFDEAYEDEHDQDECPGEDDCDDAYCDERREYRVTVTREVTFTVRAHSETEAETVAQEAVTVVVDGPHDPYGLVDDFDDGYDEWVTQDAEQLAAEERQFRAEVDRIYDEERTSGRVV